MNDATAFVVALTAFAVALTTLIPAILTLRQTKKVQAGVDEVHHMVNQQRTDSIAYQLKLTNALQDRGHAVPVDDSVTPPP